MFDLKNGVLAAQARIHPYVRETPLDRSIPLSKITGNHVFLKCENLQYTGAFKARGACNRLLTLTPEERERGVVTVSSGNHGAAVARGLQLFNIKGIVFVPENTASTKLENIANYGAPIERYSTHWIETETHARDYAKEHQMTFISPYNDLEVIHGQGTIGLELSQQLKKIDAVFVPIGGGGLISGIAGYLKAVSPHTKIIGALPANSPVMAESIKAGHIVEMETLPTLSDATQGGIEKGSITFELCQQLVDDYVLVSEAEIKDAMVTLIKTHHLLVEGASGVALGALMKTASQYANQNVVAVLSGGNVNVETLKQILCT